MSKIGDQVDLFDIVDSDERELLVVNRNKRVFITRRLDVLGYLVLEWWGEVLFNVNGERVSHQCGFSKK